MKRISTLIILFLLPNVLFAWGLGEVKPVSYLKEPFVAEIPLITVKSDTNLNEVDVGLAAKEIFHHAGIPYHKQLKELKFEIVRDAARRPMIRATSAKAIYRPELSFLVTIRWPEGSMTRDYYVSLEQRPESLKPVNTIAKSIDKPLTDKPVKAATAEPMPPVWSQADHKTFIPTTNEFTPDPSLQSAWDEAEHKANQAKGQRVQPGRYGPTSPKETLWSIATKVRPDNNIKVSQVVDALFTLNPKAFVDHNVNLLMHDVYLNIPTAEEIQRVVAGQEEAPKEKLAKTVVIADKQHSAPLTMTSTIPEADKTQPVDPVTSPEPQPAADEPSAQPVDAPAEDLTQLQTLAMISDSLEMSGHGESTFEKPVEPSVPDEGIEPTITEEVEEQPIVEQPVEEQTVEDTVITPRPQEYSRALNELGTKLQLDMDALFDGYQQISAKLDTLRQQGTMSLAQPATEAVSPSPILNANTSFLGINIITWLLIGLCLALVGMVALFWRVIKLSLQSEKSELAAYLHEPPVPQPDHKPTPERADLPGEKSSISEQLDLARAYIGMNEFNNAEPILHAAMKDGNSLEQQEARTLLGKKLNEDS